ncbi:MAG: glycosyltransferase [Anaerolineae bacterium]|nr:glycosyltransferase [Anaerolineae bacterium]
MDAMSAAAPRLTLHFIVHQDWQHVAAALASVQATVHTPHLVEITVNSGDADDVARLRAQFPAVRWHINAAPQGFAANHNAALRRAQTPYVALLNDDVLLEPGALDTLVAYLDAHPAAGLVAPRIQNPDGSPQLMVMSDISLLRALYAISGAGVLTRPGGRVRRLLLHSGLARWLGTESLQPLTHTRPVPVVVGVVMVVRQTAVAAAGGMDETTRVYGEEYGWHLRLRQHGWQVVLVTEALVTHLNPTNDLTGWRLAEHRRGTLAYFYRYRQRWEGQVLRAGIVVLHGLWALLLRPVHPARSRDHAGAVRMALATPPPAE